MVYRDRQDLSPSDDPLQSYHNRDHYLDNCFLLCINRNDETDVPEIHRLENHFIRDLCKKTPLNQGQSRHHLQDQRAQISDNDEFDFDDMISPRQGNDRDYYSRQKRHQHERDSQPLTNRSRHQDAKISESYHTQDQYPGMGRLHRRDDYNIMQHSDDELSVYEIYVPTNTLNRLSDKRIDNNMVLIDYEDVSMLRDRRPPYGHPPRPVPSHYSNYPPGNQYGEYNPYDGSTGYPREQNGQQRFYPNNPMQQQHPQQQQQPPQQRFGGYYENGVDHQPYAPQSGPFLPTNNIPMDYSNSINVRRHLYSPSQLPQGLTEGQLVMLLQKGNQYQPMKSTQVPQNLPNQTEVQPSTTSAVTVSHQPSPTTSVQIEPVKNPEYVQPVQIKIPQVPPQIIDHRLTDEEKPSTVDEITKPMSTLNTTYAIKPSKEIESKENGDKKKDKHSDSKKDKKAEKDDGGKKSGKKEKSSGKDSKKKKK